jgi:RNA polymerase-associated protein CTR9
LSFVSRRYYEAALHFVNNELASDKIYYSAIRVTIQYNMARLYEAMCEYELAERAYRVIISQHPQYIDCFLRLGCMCRDRGQIHEASEWFKEALRINQSHSDIWSLIGNLHLAREQLGPAQNQFERIIKNNDQDTYALVALGNIWLHTLYQSTRDKEKEKRHEQRSLQMYKQVLKIDPRNIWSANGVGCVLAHKSLLNEARDIFAQVREASADFCDVWLNIAHILVEQKQYIRAIQMYENCSKKFYKHTQTDVLLYLIRALYRANRLSECKSQLLKARHVAPEDTIFMFNLALVQQKLSKQVMCDDKSMLGAVKNAMYDLKAAQRTFLWLNSSGEAERLKEFRVDLRMEAKICDDLHAQGKYHLARAEKLDEQEREMKRKQEMEIKQLKMRQQMEVELKEQEAEQHKQVLMEKRAEIIKKQQQSQLDERPEKKAAKKRGKKTASAAAASSDSKSESEMTDSVSNSKGKGKSKKKRRVQADLSDELHDNDTRSSVDQESSDRNSAKSSKKRPKTSRM